MKRSCIIALAVLALVDTQEAATKNGSGAASEEWTIESEAKDLVIHSRSRAGSPLKEFRGVSVIEAAPAVVFAVLDDSEAYPSFMPYTSECRVLKREKDSVLAYQRLKLPLMNDRDYTVRSRHKTWTGAEGAIYQIHWETANDAGPAAQKDVQRVEVCEGGWLLEPQGKGATRATYSIFTDSGGALPPFLANNGSRMGIRKLFDAVRKQAREPKYAAGKN